MIRNLEIIGEAANNLPKLYREKNNHIEWNQIVGLRHRIIHAYFDVDIDIIWHVLQNDLGTFKNNIRILIRQKDSNVS